MNQNDLSIEAIYTYEKGLQQRLWRIIPKGWFVLKDFILGWMCWRLEERLLKMSRKGDGAVVKVRKKGRTYEFLEELTDQMK